MEKVPNIRGFARSVGHRFGCAAVSKVPLFELGVFVRKNNNAPVLDHMFVNTFRTLIAYGLKRDQNVFSFAVMHHLNMTKGNWSCNVPKKQAPQPRAYDGVRRVPCVSVLSVPDHAGGRTMVGVSRTGHLENSSSVAEPGSAGEFVVRMRLATLNAAKSICPLLAWPRLGPSDGPCYLTTSGALKVPTDEY